MFLSVRIRARRFLAGAFAALLISSVLLGAAAPVAASTITVVVKPSATNGWVFVQETPTGSGSFAAPPATAPLGSGSARLQVDGTGGIALAAALFQGTRFDAFDAIEYSTYRTSGSAALAPSFQFNADFNLSDVDTSFQGRLVFEPYLAPAIVSNGVWQPWDAIDGRWWASRAPFNATCSQSAPCTTAEVLATWPDAGVHSTLGAVILKAGGGWAGGFDGYVDALTITVNGNATTYDFEVETACTAVCWVDAVNGSDAYGGDTEASAKRTIQAAIDAVSPGGTVNVLPGTYNETATNRWVLGANGPHQFGLFIDGHGSENRGPLTIQGVDANGDPITDEADVEATVLTNATNNFGYSGIFVEADGVTISGLEIGPNTPGDNKTIEVIGDDFTLVDARIDVPGGGSVYLNDWRFDVDADASHVRSYAIADNRFALGASLDIASGAGYSGPASARIIEGNSFETDDGVTWPVVSFNGAGGVPWFTHPVGGATISGNSFEGQDQYIRARGTYTESQFDWESYWNDNSYERAVIVGPNPPTAVRAFSYMSGSYTFTNVRRIAGLIQSEVTNAQDGDTVLVKAGTYDEQVSVTGKSITIDGAGSSTVIAPSAPAANSTSMYSGGDVAAIVLADAPADTVTVKDVRIDGGGNGPGCMTYTGMFFRGTDGSLVDSQVVDVIDSANPGCQGAIGVFVQSGAGHNASVTIRNNAISGYGKNGITVNEAYSAAVIESNFVDGRGPVGTGDAAQNGIQVAYGATATIRGNTVTDHWYTPTDWSACGLLYVEANGVKASKNVFVGNEVNVCNAGRGGGKFQPVP